MQAVFFLHEQQKLKPEWLQHYSTHNCKCSLSTFRKQCYKGTAQRTY